ncbi:hypothetical protein HU200_013460 [Digitaria exilis]|uniref:Galactose oxidase n=1 Tax=Digitaria exilis TaxID=1010633 RepID=A0A835FE63_9POAL|nr:hypothetical protein HU200_013460 [Digitaria exilis]
MHECQAAMIMSKLSLFLHLVFLVISTTTFTANVAAAVTTEVLPLLPQDPTPPQQQAAPPPVSFPGEWHLLHTNIGVSAMHMQLLPGDFVLMFDRTDTGPSNISLSPCSTTTVSPNSGAAATTTTTPDCTAHSVLLDLHTNLLHPYPLATNPWCSSGALLPNGTLLQTGGFSSGDRVSRLFSPSTGWVELPSSLAARRWYASDVILPDGRVLVLGGRRQFNFEFFPHNSGDPTSPELTFFPFLEETMELDVENNLYPFLHLLPDGTVFVFANDRAVVFDPYNRAPLRRLPPVPGGVPRNYPSSGSSVLLPLRPENPSHAEVLVCGGAPRGAYHLALRNGTFVAADRTCARISPTVDDDVGYSGETLAWVVEEMPVARVMGDMVLLPTGDVLIVNGAAAGTAGWELGRTPVTTPVMYSPEKMIGERFRSMASTTIPRMYHSSATLDTYGRVLVGGSNPHVGYVFTNVTYPTELSLEAFLPPYMDSKLDGVRPRMVAAPAEVGYGETTAVRFAVVGVSSGEVVGVGEVRVVAVAPAFATHSFGMNQRVVEMAVGRVVEMDVGVFEVEVAAPPTPGVAPPGYYLWFVVHDGVPSSAAWVRMRPLGPGA